MKCPNCNETRVMAERQGVEIDYFPKCRGIWLDRGELDKIIEKSMKGQSSFADYDNDDDKYHANDHHSGGSHNPNDKRKEKADFFPTCSSSVIEMAFYKYREC